MGFLSKLFRKKPAPVKQNPTFNVEDLQVKALLKFKDINDDYTMTKKEMIEWSWVDEKTYQYDISVWVDLIKEDNTVKIMAEDDNEKQFYLGRIADDDAESVCALMDSQIIDHIILEAEGGKYKILHWEHIRKTNKDIYDLEKGEDEYSAKIEFYPIREAPDGNS